MKSLEETVFVLLIGAFLGWGLVSAWQESGRIKCEKDLPRTHECVQVWTPKSTSQ